MKFIADAMLGRLARWLRLLGFDTLYYPDISDQRLLKLAVRHGRLILTRDSHFRGKDCLMIDSDHVAEQVSQVIRDLRLEIPGEGRCANCNGALEDVSAREEVRDLVPEHVYIAHSRFQLCSGCGNVYWEGAQYRRLRAMRREMTKPAAKE
jgi:uncharacterized protein with PIN domain